MCAFYKSLTLIISPKNIFSCTFSIDILFMLSCCLKISFQLPKLMVIFLLHLMTICF